MSSAQIAAMAVIAAGGFILAVAIIALAIWIGNLIYKAVDNRKCVKGRALDARIRSVMLHEINQGVYQHELRYHGMHGGMSDDQAEDMKRQLKASGKL